MTGHRSPGVSGSSDSPAQAGIGAGATVEADLVVQISGPRGDTAASLRGSGRELVLQADRPDAVIAAMGGQAARARLLGPLDAAGLRGILRGPRGRVATYDPRHHSRLGSLLFGSGHVVVDRAGWAVLARTAAPPGSGARRTTLFLAAALAAAGLSRWSRHRDTGGGR